MRSRTSDVALVLAVALVWLYYTRSVLHALGTLWDRFSLGGDALVALAWAAWVIGIPAFCVLRLVELYRGRGAAGG